MPPVHRRDLVLGGPAPGRDRRRAHGRHARERGDALVHELAALDQLLQRRRPARRDRPLEHRGLHRVDDGEDELLHRRIRRPAYFSPARRRPPSSSHASAATISTASGGNRTERPAASSADALGVERQRVAALRVQPRADAAEQRARGRPPERGGRRADDQARPPGGADVVERAGGQQRAQHHRDRRAAAPRRARPRARSTIPSTTTPTRIASRNPVCSRNANSVPSKSSPRSAPASAPTSSTGRNGRIPIAAAMPRPCRRARR